MIRRPPRSTQSRSSAASDVYKRQVRAVPLRVSLHCTFATPFASILRHDITILRLPAEYGAMIALDALRILVMSAVLIVAGLTCAVRLASAPAVRLTLRSTATPSETSTQPR